jgi:hypothetical protein
MSPLRRIIITQAIFPKTVAIKIYILLALGTLFLATLFVARAYTLDMVNYVVCQAFLQKSPPGIAPEQIREAFSSAFRGSQENRESRGNHLQKLFQISQRLEKVQRLTEKDALEMLHSLKQ